MIINGGLLGYYRNGVGTANGNGGAAPNIDFVITVDTTKAGSASDTIIFPFANVDTYSGTVHYGDGNSAAFSVWNDAAFTYTYPGGSGVYQVTFEGTMGHFKAGNTGDKAKFISVDNWGLNQWGSAFQMFYGCLNLEANCTDQPDFTLAASCGFTWTDCAKWGYELNISIPEATTCQSMLDDCALMNSNVTITDAAKVSTFRNMARDCDANDAIYTITGLANAGVDFRGMFLNNLANTKAIIQDCTYIDNVGSMYQNNPLLNTKPVLTNTNNILGWDSFLSDCPLYTKDALYDFSAANAMTNYLLDTNIGTTNLDALYVGMDSQTLVGGFSLHGGDAQYTKAVSAAATARGNLVTLDLLSITDGGPTP